LQTLENENTSLAQALGRDASAIAQGRY
jgi:hypothetical protein